MLANFSNMIRNKDRKSKALLFPPKKKEATSTTGRSSTEGPNPTKPVKPTTTTTASIRATKVSNLNDSVIPKKVKAASPKTEGKQQRYSSSLSSSSPPSASRGLSSPSSHRPNSKKRKHLEDESKRTLAPLVTPPKNVRLAPRTNPSDAPAASSSLKLKAKQQQCSTTTKRLGDKTTRLPSSSLASVAEPSAVSTNETTSSPMSAEQEEKLRKKLRKEKKKKKKKKREQLQPPAESNNNHNNDGTALIAELESKYAKLLVDAHGEKRASFIQLPSKVLELLQDVWNLGESETTDRITQQMKNVQTYSPNLFVLELDSPGFPSSTFRKRDKDDYRAPIAEMDLQHALAQVLHELGYKRDEQMVNFIFSFLKSTSSIAQDPHVDFDWPTVQEPERHDSHRQQSSTTLLSPARASARHQKFPYKESVPFVAFFPLTDNGMLIEMWTARERHREPKGEDDEVGILVDIPKGVMLVARGDTVHAGGFMKNPPSSNEPQQSAGNNNNKMTTKKKKHVPGDPRGHLYIYRTDSGQVHATATSNTYTLPGASVRLDKVYRHCPEAAPAPVTRKGKFAFVRAYNIPTDNKTAGSNNNNRDVSNVANNNNASLVGASGGGSKKAAKPPQEQPPKSTGFNDDSDEEFEF